MAKNTSSKVIIGLILFVMMANVFSFFVMSDSESVEKESVSIFTLSFDGVQKEYSLDDLKAFPSVTGNGGRLKVTGDVIGPYEYTGVSIETLAAEFSSLPSRFDMVTISDDGYVFKYTFDQIQGKVQIYDNEGNSQGIGDVNMILAYAEDGDPLVHGGPLRIAFVDDTDVVTDAFLWSKYVEEIEFVFDTSDSNPPDISIDKPVDAIYYFDQKLISYSYPLVIGDITFEVSVYDENEIAKVMFIINNDIKSKQIDEPYRWNFDEKGFGKYIIKIVSYDDSGNMGVAQKEFTMFNFF
jgi:hypothetical protein